MWQQMYLCVSKVLTHPFMKFTFSYFVLMNQMMKYRTHSVFISFHLFLNLQKLDHMVDDYTSRVHDFEPV